jgi:hypothetical protein
MLDQNKVASADKALIILLVLQVIAVLIYPFSFFRASPQSQVLPPTLLLLFIAALITMNTGVLNPVAGRTSLVFVQGINMIVRLMMFMPNLKNSEEQWYWSFMVIQVIAMALSWYTITKMEKRLPRSLLLWK